METSQKNNANFKMAKIPYIEHQKRMFKAYEDKKRLMLILISSNVLWAICAALLLIMR